jgi:uncharacterized protein (TIGR02246 family)
MEEDMKSIGQWGVLLLSIASLACKQEYKLTRDSNNADVVAIRGLLDRVMEVSRQGDLEAYLSLYTEDALWMRRDRITDAAKDDVRPAYKFMEDYTFDQQLTINEIAVSGDIAYTRATFDGWIIPRPGKQLERVRALSRHIMILERQSDDSWKFSRDIFINPKIDTTSRK